MACRFRDPLTADCTSELIGNLARVGSELWIGPDQAALEEILAAVGGGDRAGSAA